MENNRKKVIALGFFDGVHLGHQALLRRAVERAAEKDMAPAVFTFDRSPKEFVTGVPIPLLTSVEERREVVNRLFPGVEVIIAPFDHEMMTMPWGDFVLMLTQRYHAGWLVAGHDYRFGYKNTGTPDLLVKKAGQLGMGCDIIPAVTLDGITVSSTHIRALLERGEAEKAARFLGYPFAITGFVRHGKGPGSPIGAPTLNLVPGEHQLIPACGVYVTNVSVDEARYAAITNVCVRPTADRDRAVTVASHLLDQSIPLCGQRCRVEFLKMLRSERQFDTPEELREQIARDAAEAKQYFEQTN